MGPVHIPGCKEIFDEGITGFGFEPKNIDSLTQAILKFIKLPNEEKLAMGKEGCKKVERKFNRSKVVDAYIQEINRIVEEK